MAEWKKTRVTNMIRRDGKTYYAQIKIAGKTYRRSLGTSKFDVARLKLEGSLRDIKDGLQHQKPAQVDLALLGGCIEAWKEKQKQRPDLKESTRHYWLRCARVLCETLPCDVPPAMVNTSTLRDWWEVIAERFHSTYANNLLSAAVAVLDMQVVAGYRKENPARELKRVKAVEEIRHMPSPEQFMRIVDHVRGQNKRYSDESADFMCWVAYCGMRPSEVESLVWEDVGKDRITVRGGDTGTKNRRQRMIPIIGALMELVERRRQPSGAVFYIKTPRIALRNACKRMGVAHLRVYDLRHLFATRCIESGVDFATVGKWLGHSDGGSLAARVYGHVRDEHGLELAKRVKF